MLKKAWKITKNNQSMLVGRFNVDPLDLEQVPLGYYLVTDFGNDDTFDILSSATLIRDWDRTGAKLENGAFEIALKVRK